MILRGRAGFVKRSDPASSAGTWTMASSAHEAAGDDMFTPTFAPLDDARVTFVTQNRLTVSDVLATTVTVFKRPIPHTSLGHPDRAASTVTKPKMKLPPPAAPMTLPIPRKRMNKILHAERDAYMTKLHRERDVRTRLETWAATKIQARFRGHRVRPKAKAAYECRRRTNLTTVIRKELNEMQQGLPGPTMGHKADPWRQDVTHRAFGKREAKHRKDMLNHAATVIQACVKRFLARVAFIHLLSRHVDEMVLWSTIVVQAAYRGYIVRKRIAARLAQLQEASVIKIQSVVRGILGRERVALIRLELHAARGHHHKEAEAAVTVQRLIRGRNGRKSAARRREGRAMKIADWHLDERRAVTNRGSLVLVDDGVMRIEPRASLKPPLNINTTHLHREEAAVKLQALARGNQTRQRQHLAMGPRRTPDDKHMAEELIAEVHAVEEERINTQKRLASLLPKADRLDVTEAMLTEGPRRRQSKDIKPTTAILPREDSALKMYTETHTKQSRRNSSFETRDVGDAATRIQALARGNLSRKESKRRVSGATARSQSVAYEETMFESAPPPPR
ncbi:Aste57867_14025 [Aphanomyces stellatus]|uniref:Aste57867_14025 protein n=1 Tax=Aphanomyces stellatus TaxID=120398 RepID=A0A485KZN1_9STRA|nr:hypothetical protein As57867_013974 [Aphanomyces stellatus]VFT90855.1 Aste57867_14025 [Aphanomyces stellatus]